MINFQPVKLVDKATMDPYYKRTRMEGSEGTFANSFMWRNAYKIRWAIVEDALCITADRGERDFFIPPIGALTDESFKKAMEALKEHSLGEGCKPEYRGISLEMKERIENLFPGEFDLIADRDNFDYTYLTQDLINLAGRAFHGKKNHANQFRRAYPNYEYRPITKDIIPATIDFALEWCRQRGCDGELSLAMERDAIVECLELFDELGYKGGVILVDGKVQAFTYGEMLNDDTAIIHVEKGNGEFKGIYAVINQEFCQEAWPDTTYINREEDMGEPGLRKAKESYRPVKMIEKYVACSK